MALKSCADVIQHLLTGFELHRCQGLGGLRGHEGSVAVGNCPIPPIRNRYCGHDRVLPVFLHLLEQTRVTFEKAFETLDPQCSPALVGQARDVEHEVTPEQSLDIREELRRDRVERVAFLLATEHLLHLLVPDQARTPFRPHRMEHLPEVFAEGVDVFL